MRLFREKEKNVVKTKSRETQEVTATWRSMVHSASQRCNKDKSVFRSIIIVWYYYFCYSLLFYVVTWQSGESCGEIR